MHIHNEIQVLLPFLLHVSMFITPSSGRRFCMFRTIVIFCDYIRLQLL